MGPRGRRDQERCSWEQSTCALGNVSPCGVSCDQEPEPEALNSPLSPLQDALAGSEEMQLHAHQTISRLTNSAMTETGREELQDWGATRKKRRGFLEMESQRQLLLKSMGAGR